MEMVRCSVLKLLRWTLVNKELHVSCECYNDIKIFGGGEVVSNIYKLLHICICLSFFPGGMWKS